MHKKISKKIEKQIQGKLYEREFLKKIDFQRKDLSEIVKNHISSEQISDFFEAGKFEASDFLRLTKPLLEAVCEKEPSEGWLAYIYKQSTEALYAEHSEEKPDAATKAALLYLEILAVVLKELVAVGKVKKGYYFEFLTDEELGSNEEIARYNEFLRCFAEDKIFETMWIGADVTKYNFLGHVGGVHHIAMHAAKQLHALGIPVDLGLVSAAAAGHDIGKYGCKGEEEQRIPYLHYYYTDVWFKKHGLSSIGHIAANHSTWDLELENLSVESLLLIYADFRVKQDGYYENGKEKIRYYTLDEAFEVILNKLDNVDEAKEKRYKKVYGKLKDFEKYMESIGVDTLLEGGKSEQDTYKNPAVLSAGKTVQLLKFMAIEHNIKLMNILGNDASFAAMQEAARSEKDWRNTRAYLNVFEEYFAYMTPRQKQLTLDFLMDQFTHKEGDIRRQAALLMGKILVNFEVEYQKELPKGVIAATNEISAMEMWEKYLEKMFLPNHKIIEQHRRWSGFAFKRVVEKVFEYCKEEDKSAYLERIVKYYRSEGYDEINTFMMLDTIRVFPLKVLSKEDFKMILSFACRQSNSPSNETKAAVLRVFKYFLEESENLSENTTEMIEALEKMDSQDNDALSYMKSTLLEALTGQKNNKSLGTAEPAVVSDIFLKNMKIATPWMLKEINIGLLLQYVKSDATANIVQVATHFSNLLKNSERITVRHTAGRALLETAPLLRREQRNEIAIELSKGLETGEYEFSKYIPQYLGQFVLWLYPAELDEFLLELKKFLYNANERVVCVSLSTIGEILRRYHGYRQRFLKEEDEDSYEKRRKALTGMLISGMANYNPAVNQEAFMVLGSDIFADLSMPESEKVKLFNLTYRKITTIVPEQEKSQLAFLNNAAALNHIYRFISEYMFKYGKFVFNEPEKVVFFPGTFDPFSLSHKKIATLLRDMGYGVYLAIDEFSWSKKTQPRMIRKQIIAMTIAGEENIFIFPEEIPVNIANPKDLKRLREVFESKELYLAVGADVVKNASSYKVDPEPWSVQSMNHIIFKRFDVQLDYSKVISGKIVEMELPESLADISSTLIRDYVDKNRDISNLVDEVVQNYIYENQLYLREPEYKPVMGGDSVELEVHDKCSPETIEALKREIVVKYGNDDKIVERLAESGAVLMIDRSQNDKIISAAVFKNLATPELYEEFKNREAVEYIRDKTSGRILLLQGIYTFGKSQVREREQHVLTEALANALAQDYTYCVYSPQTEYASPRKEDFLRRQGFVKLETSEKGRRIFVVDMKRPLAVFKNIATVIKAPFNEDPEVIDTIDKIHGRLQVAMTKLYPGNLVLSFDSVVMYKRMLKIITRANNVPEKPTAERKLGELMCVPFGKILRGVAAPNTVTKTLHTEKVFSPDLKEYEITNYPNYLSLAWQVRTLKSFKRNVILVDDILNKGYRIKELDPIFKKENVKIDRLVVGLLSGRGKDIMEIQDRQVESVYYLPTLKAWFVESTVYPFIGGDMVDKNDDLRANLISSINFILPYAYPGFISDASKASVYNLSMVCLENARDLLEVLERVYQEKYGKQLTLKRLGEVVISPCSPDRGNCFECDYNLPASNYVKDDIERLKRLEKLMKEY